MDAQTAIIHMQQALADEGLTSSEIDEAMAEFDRNPPEEWLQAKSIIEQTLVALLCMKRDTELFKSLANQRIMHCTACDHEWVFNGARSLSPMTIDMAETGVDYRHHCDWCGNEGREINRHVPGLEV